VRRWRAFKRPWSFIARRLEADPTFAGAYTGLATTELMLGMLEASDLAESISRARVLALKAYEMDPELPEAHDGGSAGP
tara:strand:+ start:247 stop:483 length:237 start_codon:yes stop_codon:yes gene_type:complete